MDKYTWYILLALLGKYVFVPVLRMLWEHWQRRRQAQQAERWRQEDKIIKAREQREAYKQATKHAGRVYVLRKSPKRGQ
jgi:hypothetical protein